MTQPLFPGGRVFTVKEAAALLKVSVATVKNYLYQRKLKSIKTPGGHHRIPESELLALWRDITRTRRTASEPASSATIQEATVRRVVRSILQALMRALDSRDTFAVGHSGRVSRYGAALSKRMGLSRVEQEELELASLLHDVGKVAVNDAILHKPGRLSDEEYAAIRQHPQLGVQIVAETELLKGTLPAILHHHERYDGQGYPDGLARNQIPMAARIIAVAEAFDAMTAHSAYRTPLSARLAYRELQRAAGSQFDPQVVRHFLALKPLKAP